ncbi:MAG: DUF4868 domain-containing protein [Candidatus Aenigmatarchaeota archaeon]
MALNLIAMVKENNNISFKRVNLTSGLQNEITSHFLNLKQKVEENERVEFNIEYKLDKNQIWEIKSFKLDENIVNAVKNPLGLKSVTETDIDKIKALFCGKWEEKEKFILFQTFDIRKLIYRKGINIIFDRNTFDKLKKPVIIIANSIEAIFEENNLVFKSFTNAKKIFDNLKDYFREATDEELREFSEKEIIDLEDKIYFTENADSEVRKSIALIKSSGVLEKDFSKIHKAANKFGLKEYFDKKNKKIKFPRDKKEIKTILKFLNEDIFEAPITERKFITNSKREFERG